jgi:ribonuclease E
MPSDADLPEFDEQDQAEVFDEDNYSLDGAGDAGSDFKTFEELPDVYDVTRALGDADVDETLTAEDADELEEDELDDIELEYDDEAEDDRIDDNMDTEPEEFDDTEEDDDDLDEVDGLTDLEPDEAQVEYVADVESTTSNSGRVAQHFESRGQLSNEDLEELGYRDEEGDQ